MMNKLKPAQTSLTAFSLLLISLLAGCSNPSKNPAPVIDPSSPKKQATTPKLPDNPIISANPATSTVSTTPPITPQPATTENKIEVAPTTNTHNTEQIKQAQEQLRKLVILLPDRPTLTEANRDIEKGIRAAHAQLAHNPHLQLIFIHEPLSGEALYQKASNHSPDWIIGPLTKTDIQSVQTLAQEKHIFLNRLEAPTKSLQLGLPIEDELDQLVSMLPADKGQVLVIATADAQEQRVLTQFLSKATANQLKTIAMTVDKNRADIQDWLLKEGGIQDSLERNKRLAQQLKADFSNNIGRSRQDIQAIVFLGNAKSLRSIMSSIHYHQIKWPVYATSRLLPTKATDNLYEPELDGVFVLTPPYLSAPSSVINPFEALGWDSYYLLANPQAQIHRFQTGNLVNQANHMKRQLPIQRIKDGKLSTTP